mmetsp:Transcript_21540/g.48430  ORF Transcript_21540/g.48430 Transcript_21540/m.48430 type:complete len:214 (+) Transcript_21540:567-1208(+)
MPRTVQRNHRNAQGMRCCCQLASPERNGSHGRCLWPGNIRPGATLGTEQRKHCRERVVCRRCLARCQQQQSQPPRTRGSLVKTFLSLGCGSHRPEAASGSLQESRRLWTVRVLRERTTAVVVRVVAANESSGRIVVVVVVVDFIHVGFHRTHESLRQRRQQGMRLLCEQGTIPRGRTHGGFGSVGRLLQGALAGSVHYCCCCYIQQQPELTQQ